LTNAIFFSPLGLSQSLEKALQTFNMLLKLI